jgi:CRP-like cAMP-binding protein
MFFGKKQQESTEWLSSIPFFEGFSESDLQRVAELGTEVEAAAGTVIMDQGDPGTECFVIESGVASVYVRGEHVASLDAGSMVGEMALVDHRPRMATVAADTDLRLVRFDSKAFRTLLDEMPAVSEKVLTILSNRLKSAGG